MSWVRTRIPVAWLLGAVIENDREAICIQSDTSVDIGDQSRSNAQRVQATRGCHVTLVVDELVANACGQSGTAPGQFALHFRRGAQTGSALQAARPSGHSGIPWDPSIRANTHVTHCCDAATSNRHMSPPQAPSPNGLPVIPGLSCTPGEASTWASGPGAASPPPATASSFPVVASPAASAVVPASSRAGAASAAASLGALVGAGPQYMDGHEHIALAGKSRCAASGKYVAQQAKQVGASSRRAHAR
jgi:hypothetical protein